MRRALICLLLLAVIAGCGLGDPDENVTPDTATPESVRFVAIGGDETVDRDPDSRRRESWPRLVFREHLPPQAVFADLARPGSTVADAIDEQLATALDFAPTLAVVWLTSADVERATAVEEYRTGLTNLATALGDGDATVMVVIGSDTPDSYALAARRAAEESGATAITLSDESDESAIAEQIAGALRLGD